ncbi:hypothetical protein X777_10791 [Ooceraea biroi]|uniref:Uncharacterized protein n=1 Tax=Ooceraea biroi TaxID=2015173 RepID=A0A026W542_OOCBI|nr:hypothetical protein X777_10791 [Ooceraea biroi]
MKKEDGRKGRMERWPDGKSSRRENRARCTRMHAFLYSGQKERKSERARAREEHIVVSVH